MYIQKYSPVPVVSTVLPVKKPMLFMHHCNGQLRSCYCVAAPGCPLRPTQNGLQSSVATAAELPFAPRELLVCECGWTQASSFSLNGSLLVKVTYWSLGWLGEFLVWDWITLVIIWGRGLNFGWFIFHLSTERQQLLLSLRVTFTYSSH